MNGIPLFGKAGRQNQMRHFVDHWPIARELTAFEFIVRIGLGILIENKQFAQIVEAEYRYKKKTMK